MRFRPRLDRGRVARYSGFVEYRALIVDDEETYARSMERLLARRGVVAERAGSSAEALALVRRRHYDLVLLDYLLPDGTGLELIAPLRALRPAPQVLMMTAFGTIENAVEAMRRGAYDYVTKSTAIEGIVERVLEMRRVAQVQEARGMTPPLPPLPSLTVSNPVKPRGTPGVAPATSARARCRRRAA